MIYIIFNIDAKTHIMQFVAITDLTDCNNVYPDPSRSEILKSHWMPQFPDDSIIINLSNYAKKVLLTAANIYRSLGKIPSMLYDEDPFFTVPDYPFFARFDHCSFKDGIHQTKPLSVYKHVIENIVTSKRAFSVLEEPTLPILYITRYRDDWTQLEFRCFMYQRILPPYLNIIGLLFNPKSHNR